MASLYQHSQNRRSTKIILFENIQLTQPAGRYMVEFGAKQMRLIGSKEFTKEPRDVTRVLLLERPSKQHEK